MQKQVRKQPRNLYQYTTLFNEYQILRFILQPIVENCIIHGIEPNSGVGIIGIEVSEIPSGIQINISDNGVGIDKEIFYQNLNRSK